MQGFSNYLSKFADGGFSVGSKLLSADIYNTRKDFQHALTYYGNVAQKAPNSYAEASVLQAARICYFELKDYKQAEQYFSQLKSLATTPENKLESERGCCVVNIN